MPTETSVDASSPLNLTLSISKTNHQIILN